jgi:lipopolysaccharide export system protein LptA
MGKPCLGLTLVLLLIAFGGTAWTAQGANSQQAAGQTAPQQPEDQAPAKPIVITADRLISDTQNNLARFEGSVKAMQGDTTIEADRLTVHYKKEGNPQAAAGADALSKITASGNVRIKFDNRLAVTDEAVYITDQRILTLTGSPARVTSGKDQVTGAVITLHRDSGRIEVQGGGSQVEAILHSGEKGIE